MAQSSNSIIATACLLKSICKESSYTEARSGQNYLINFLLCIFNFMSFVFNSKVERINFMACIFNFLIRPINFMLCAFNYMVCGINFMLDIFKFVTHPINFMLYVFSFMAVCRINFKSCHLILPACITYTLCVSNFSFVQVINFMYLN